MAHIENKVVWHLYYIVESITFREQEQTIEF